MQTIDPRTLQALTDLFKDGVITQDQFTQTVIQLSNK